MIKIWQQNSKGLNFLLIFLAIFVISILRAWSIFNYSTWSVDEEQTVIHALGFLGYDFNPHWFGYHTLPMYILSIFYFTAYYILLLLGVVSSSTEFVSFVYREHSYFFITAKILFSFAHTLGCFVIAHVIAKHYKSKIGAIAFLLIVFIVPESIVAANVVRVDTFVFLFMTLTIYFSCYAEKNQINFILSIIFCTAAFASKMPAIIFFPILYFHQLYLIYKGSFPKYYLLYLCFVPILSLFIFMPFMFIDYESYYQHLLNIAERASGQTIHVGKTHLYDWFSKLKALYLSIAVQVGVVAILSSVALPLIMIYKKDRSLVISSLYLFAFCGMFITSSFVDSYWLIPVFPYFIFYTVVLIVLFAKYVSHNNFYTKTIVHKSKAITANGTMIILLLVFVVSSLGLKSKGLTQYINIINNDIDTRVVAENWIQKNLSPSSTIILDGFIQHYLPRILSVNKNDTLKNSYFNIMGAIGRNNYLMESFNYYYAQERKEHQAFNAKAMDSNFRINYDLLRMTLPLGAYIIISDRIYNRFYIDNTSKVAPTVTKNALAFYRYIKSQKHIKNFSGYGPKIDIYQITEPYLKALEKSNTSTLDEQYQAALYYQNKGDMKLSLAYLANIIPIEPSYPHALFLEGWAYQKLNRWPEAEKTYKKALKYYPLHVQTRFNLAYGLMSMNRCIESIIEFKEVITIDPKNGSAHYWLGKCYKTIGEIESSESHKTIYQNTRK